MATLFYLVSVLLCALPVCAPADDLVWFGTRQTGPGVGFSLARFDPATGVLTPPAFLLEAGAPAFFVVHPDGRHLYAINALTVFEGQPAGSVSAYSIDRTTGRLTLLNKRSSGGPGPCHVSLDAAGRFALIANYTDGSVAVFALQPDGSLGERTAFMRHTGSSVHPQRQTKPYAHSIKVDPTNRFALVPDLGADRVVIYRFDGRDGSLVPNDPPFAALAPGSGPRHLAWHPNGRWLYVINELACTIAAFSWDADRGVLADLQTISTLPADFTGTSTCAEIEVHPSGRYVYGSNRGHDSIAVFAVDPAGGRLTPIQHAPTRGSKPRNFALDPTGRWLIATNHDSDNATVFAVDSDTGRLTATGEPVGIPVPYGVRFLPLP